MNVGVSVKNQMIGVFMKIIICGILARDCECIKTCKTDKYLHTKNCSCKKCVQHISISMWR